MWIRLPRHKWCKNHCQTLKILCFFLNDICTVAHLLASCGRDSLRNVLIVNANRTKLILRRTERCLNPYFSAGATQKIARVGDISREKLSHRHMTWNVTRKSAQNDIASERRKRFRNCIMVSTPSLDDHHFEKEKLETFGDLSKVCSQFVLKCLYLDRMGGPDIRWSANKLPWAVTKWTRACDWRLARLISYFHRHHCHLCNTAQHCRLVYSKTQTLCWRSWRF